MCIASSSWNMLIVKRVLQHAFLRQSGSFETPLRLSHKQPCLLKKCLPIERMPLPRLTHHGKERPAMMSSKERAFGPLPAVTREALMPPDHK
jgi:hypothetical protein